MEEQIQYPLFYPCTKTKFTSLDKSACVLLGFPDTYASDYCKPIIDVNGKYYFTVNPEVSSLVDLTKCVPYEDIVLPTPEPIV